MIYKAGELKDDRESQQIVKKTAKLCDKLFPKRDLSNLEDEINAKIQRLTDSYYTLFNSSMVGLNLLDVYFNSLNGIDKVNNKPLAKLIKKQLDYMRNGESGDLFRDSKLMAENITRLLSDNGLIEIKKTSDEIKQSVKDKAKAKRVTSFEFNGQKNEVKGEHLTLEECVSMFCEKRYINDFYTFKSREFFIKKYGVKHECR